jgi:hypothetical protein
MMNALTMAGDDPFSVFGDDDSDDEPSFTSQQLLKAANDRMSGEAVSVAMPVPVGIQKHNQERLPLHTGVTSPDPGSGSIDVSSLPLATVSWKRPLYLGPMVLTTQDRFGGGRAYVASRDLPPGTLVLVEEPIVKWPSDQLGKPLDLISVKHFLSNRKAQEFLHDLEDFHPTKATVDAAVPNTTPSSGPSVQVGDMLKMLQKQLEPGRIEEIVQLAKDLSLTNRNKSAVSTTDILRLLLALRYNGLESGIYLHVAMINHSCRPNCTKFLPHMTNYSEVRTTRHVSAGEALTISYLSHIASHATRRQILWDQHRFDIGGTCDSSSDAMELVNGRMPASSPENIDMDSLTWHIEQAIAALEDHHQEAAANLGDPAIWDQLQALELSCEELCVQAKHQLQNDSHVLLIPCLRLHLDVCDLFQRGSLSAQQRNALLVRSILSGHALLELQTLYYGPHHFELAKTCLELSHAIREILSHSPKMILSCNVPGLATFADCSTLEQHCKRNYQRIKAMYPRDAEDFIGTNNGDCQQS